MTELSRESKIVCGVLLIVIPTIIYGRITLLGALTGGIAGLAPGRELSELQFSLWRAGHAHAGVIVILSLILQPLVDHTSYSISTKWVARSCAPIASVLLSAGFFGLAFAPGFKWVIYIGVIFLATSLLLTGIGLLKNIRPKVEH